jgi:hypothetical protein
MLNMKRIIGVILMLGLFSLSTLGCGEKATTKTETTITTPGGKTTVTTEKEVKQTGDNPPPAR